jgi:uncharacterized membrane protein
MLRVGESGQGRAPAGQAARGWSWTARLRRLLLLLTLAAIAHLLTVLLLPRYAQNDAASLYLATGADGRAEIIGDGTDRLPTPIDADPLTVIAVCGYDLADGPLRVSARTGNLPLAISLHVRGGGVFYALTDTAAQRGLLEFVVLTRAQFEDRLARDDDGDGAQELRVVAPARQGIVVARALARRASEQALGRALVSGVACGAAG